MKKILGLLLVLVIAGGAAFYFLYYKQAGPQATPAQILPKDTLAVLEARELKKSIDGFRNGPLGQALKGIDIQEAGRQLGADAVQVGELIQMRDQIVQGLESPWFGEFFGQEVMLGVLPLTVDRGEKPTPELFQRALVLITRPQQPADLLDTLGKMLVKDLKITTETIDGHTINRAVSGGSPPFFYAVAHGLAIIGLDPDPILRCLAQNPEEQSGLAQATAYQALEPAGADDPNLRFRFFMDLQQSATWLSESAPRLGADVQDLAELRRGLDYVGGLKALDISGSAGEGNLLRTHLRLRHDPQATHPLVADALKASPAANPTLTMVPADPIYYGWQNTHDLTRIWEALKSSEDFSPQDRARAEQAFNNFMGLEVEQALAALGSQIAWLLNDLISGGFFPIPEAALILEARDPEVVARMLERLTANFNLPMASEAHGDLTLFYAQTPLGADLEPAYLCDSQFCIVATNRRLLKAMVPPNESAGLRGNPKFTAVDQGLSGNANQVLFLDMESAVENAKDLIQWGASMAAMTHKAEAPKITYAMNHIITPLLDGLAQYPALGMKTVMAEQLLTTDLYLQAPPAPE
ncbi:MAG: hypothetical protein WBG37_01970 [Desulfobacterales bacterium]